MLFEFPLILASATESSSDHGGGHSVIYNISLCLVMASGMGLLCRVFRQPVMLGHLLAGVVLGPIGLKFITDHSEIQVISEIGLILLLFMIGLEIDLHKMLQAGKWIIVPGLLQVPICLGFGLLIFSGLSAMGFQLGQGKYVALYCAITMAISSTMIVVKLLYEKSELDTLPGRITVGILVFQDIWAIIFLAIQPNLANPAILDILKTFGSGFMLIATALLLSRYVLPHIFKVAATSGELMLVLALGWCFLVSLTAAHPMVGLSMEMGALIAGVTLATFPYSHDVIGKVTSIRDFFITLFFVSLAMQIPMPQMSVLSHAMIIAIVAMTSRFLGIYLVLYLLKAGHRAALLASINLSQVSEFTLVIIALGISFGHVDQAVQTQAIWVFSFLAVASTYIIKYNDTIQRYLTKRLTKLGLADVAVTQTADQEKEYPIVMLGFYRNASAIVHDMAKQHPEWIKDLKVIDTNPIVKERLDDMKILCHYGDISHKDTLEHAHIHHAKLVMCTIPDFILKGTDNARLLKQIRQICPDARVIVTAQSPSQARELYAQGASYVIQPTQSVSPAVLEAMDMALHHSLDATRDEAIRELATRNEVLA